MPVRRDFCRKKQQKTRDKSKLVSARLACALPARHNFTTQPPNHTVNYFIWLREGKIDCNRAHRDCQYSPLDAGSLCLHAPIPACTHFVSRKVGSHKSIWSEEQRLKEAGVLWKTKANGSKKHCGLREINITDTCNKKEKDVTAMDNVHRWPFLAGLCCSLSQRIDISQTLT